MALVNCPECGNEISSKASVCPHCGVKISNCPECGYTYIGQTDCCPSCGKIFSLHNRNEETLQTKYKAYLTVDEGAEKVFKILTVAAQIIAFALILFAVLNCFIFWKNDWDSVSKGTSIADLAKKADLILKSDSVYKTSLALTASASILVFAVISVNNFKTALFANRFYKRILLDNLDGECVVAALAEKGASEQTLFIRLQEYALAVFCAKYPNRKTSYYALKITECASVFTAVVLFIVFASVNIKLCLANTVNATQFKLQYSWLIASGVAVAIFTALKIITDSVYEKAINIWMQNLISDEK